MDVIDTRPSCDRAVRMDSLVEVVREVWIMRCGALVVAVAADGRRVR